MISEIINLLKHSNSSNSYIQIAKGKNKMPENLKEAYSQIKNELNWKLNK
jgi:hypothetical protein|tara:strand:- start:2487 stop:2636 length:150 start_codon:yes stop_codon:yes gene_type:complete